MSDQPNPATCPATKTGDTASGPDTIRCEKPAGHVEAGDPRHHGHAWGGKGMSAYWVDRPVGA